MGKGSGSISTEEGKTIKDNIKDTLDNFILLLEFGAEKQDTSMYWLTS